MLILGILLILFSTVGLIVGLSIVLPILASIFEKA